MPTKLTDRETVPVMLAAGLKPLEPYPGSKEPWLCKHKCGRTVSPRYNNIQRGKGGCWDCRNDAIAVARTLDVKVAKAVMLAAELKPLEPYPGAIKPWRCLHKCGRTVSPSYNSIQQGRKGCEQCGRESSARSRMLETKFVVAVMRKAGLRPLEPYPGGDKPWRCLHGRCGRIVSPSYHDVQQGHSGCVYCGNKAMAQALMLDAAVAEATMLDAGLEPLEPYLGNKKPWRSRHLCGRIVSPRYNSIHRGQGGCRFCAEYGIDFSKPGWLYFMFHAKFNLLQIGITTNAKRRLSEHRRVGWTLIEVMGSWEMARDTETWERALLAALKQHGAVFAKDAEIQFNGLTITEAWTRDSFDASSLEELLTIVLVEERTKLAKANELGVKVITPDEFATMLGL